MALRVVKYVLGGLLAVVVAVMVFNAVTILSAGAKGVRELIVPAGLIVCAALLAGTYYGVFFRRLGAFSAFRIVIGAVVAGGVLYLLALAGAGLHEAATDTPFKTSALTMPVVMLVGALVVGALFYFAVVAPSGVHRVLENIFSIPELLKKLAFTAALLAIYRIGYHIPVPGLDQQAIQNFMQQQEQGAFGQALQYFAMFTGGNLQRSTLFGLGIMPYISASIIFQLLVPVVPALEKLQKEGQAGYRKIQEYTRYATVALCIIQGAMWMRFMMAGSRDHDTLVYAQYAGSMGVFLMGVLGMTAGTVFLMWLGEQIDEYGIGNGISLIIMAGIVARMPWAINQLVSQASLKVTGAEGSEIGLIKIVFLIAAFVFVVAGSILITQAQRRIPIQQAKHTRGRRVYGGQRQYLPLRVNHGGVMPIIFASSLMLFPNMLARAAANRWGGSSVARFFQQAFEMNSTVYDLCYVGLIFFFSYFWTTVQFRPKELSDQLRDSGSFIPGLRPGRRTAEYLERVMERITYCGAGFLAVIAVIPQIVALQMKIPFEISAYLGGTGLLIMVSVALDLVQRIEANLIMRNYGGFLAEGGRIKGAR